MADRVRSARAPRAAANADVLADLLAAKEMVVVCGSGGTGKTTIAAALGARAAVLMSGRVLVLTVDPARRLATALGLADTGSAAVQVSPELLGGGETPRGELWVAMLDTKAGWDELIHRHAPDAAVAAKILDNPLYRNITSRFVHSHDYLAMEQLHELHASGRYDLVIIDTPPSRNALDLLDAPKRMGDFFGGRLLRWLTVPYRSRLFNAATQPFYAVADRVLGSRFLRDIADFFVLFQTMEKGFVARARQVEQLLRDDRTAFVVVTTLDAAPSHEARFLVDELRRRRLPLGAVVANRVLPATIREPKAKRAAAALCQLDPSGAAVRALATSVSARPADVAAVLTQAGELFPDLAVLAAREAERRRELAEQQVPLVDVPLLPSDVTDLAALAVIGRSLAG
jgi:anion-transporting  ArsA/GET3 family ATPase